MVGIIPISNERLGQSKSVVVLYNQYYTTQYNTTVLPARSDSDVMFCLQRYKGLRIDKSLVY